ncbi:uncharacterized protein LOC144660502 isoform X1 [Oculina patagonica]
MFIHDVVPRLCEFFISVVVLLIAAFLLLTFVLSTVIDFAMRSRDLSTPCSAEEPPLTSSPIPEPECQAPTKIEPNKVEIERQTTSRRKRNLPPPSNEIETARAVRVQSMIEAHRRGLNRLYAGRKRAVALIRAANRIRKKHALDLEEKGKAWEQLCSRLNAVMRERERELKAWVKQIQEESNPPLASLERQNQIRMSASVHADRDVNGPQLSPVTESVIENDADLTCEAGGLAQNPGKECSDMNQEKTSAIRNSADVAAIKNKQDEEDTHNPSHNPNGTKMPDCRVLGDSKTIKMKFGKNNKLASLMEDSKVGDGFYVFL